MRVAVLLIGALLLPAFVPAAAHAQTPAETRVWNGFMRLGLSRDKAWCYAQIIGQMFTHDIKPLEVEILVAEVGSAPEADQLFHISYDGTVVDEHKFSVIGGEAEAIAERVERDYRDAMSLGEAVKATVSALGGPDRRIEPAELEIAVLARSLVRRAFRRIADDEIASFLG